MAGVHWCPLPKTALTSVQHHFLETPMGMSFKKKWDPHNADKQLSSSAGNLRIFIVHTAID